MKILVEESVLRQALESLEYSTSIFANDEGIKEAIAALRSTLDSAEKVKPVAYEYHGRFSFAHIHENERALYSAPTPTAVPELTVIEMERDELKTWLEDQVCEAKDFAYKLESKTVELATVTKERDELAEALKWYVDEDDVIEEMEGNEYWVKGKRRAEAILAKVGDGKTGEGS